MKIVNILGVALAFIASAALAHQSTETNRGGRTVGANGMSFIDVDSNGDGWLTPIETRKLLAMQNFIRQDTNNDGLISEAEFGRNGGDPDLAR